MARASNIYFVRHNGTLVAAFTVKYEAVEWAKRHNIEELQLSRMRDGMHEKVEEQIKWE
jgi:hypothetical protein